MNITRKIATLADRSSSGVGLFSKRTLSPKTSYAEPLDHSSASSGQLFRCEFSSRIWALPVTLDGSLLLGFAAEHRNIANMVLYDRTWRQGQRLRQ
jgi:hypothetical protein